MKLYSYWRSSAAYRVRIALALKGLSADYVPVHLIRDGGEQNRAAYQAINPQRLLPALELDDGTVLTQSLAIIEYLDEIVPQPPLLPATALERARVRALAQVITSDIHPLTNLRVLKYINHAFPANDEARIEWIRHWINEGLTAFEKRLEKHPQTGRFCHGDTPTLADCCLVPQLYDARRFKLDLAPFPRLTQIETACLALPAFMAAHPDQQPDAG